VRERKTGGWARAADGRQDVGGRVRVQRFDKKIRIYRVCKNGVVLITSQTMPFCNSWVGLGRYPTGKSFSPILDRLLIRKKKIILIFEFFLINGRW
jgi:hypothetical protein